MVKKVDETLKNGEKKMDGQFFNVEFTRCTKCCSDGFIGMKF